MTCFLRKMPALSEGVCEVLGGLSGEVRDAWAPVTSYGSHSSLSPGRKPSWWSCGVYDAPYLGRAASVEQQLLSLLSSWREQGNRVKEKHRKHEKQTSVVSFKSLSLACLPSTPWLWNCEPQRLSKRFCYSALRILRLTTGEEEIYLVLTWALQHFSSLNLGKLSGLFDTPPSPRPAPLRNNDHNADNEALG